MGGSEGAEAMGSSSRTENPYDIDVHKALSARLGMDNVNYLLRVPAYAESHNSKDGISTAAPARLLGLARRIGSLRPGAAADAALFRLVEAETEIIDAEGAGRIGHRRLEARCTLVGGRIAWWALGGLP